jgi:outer membrane protein assembly factor BamB
MKYHILEKRLLRFLIALGFCFLGTNATVQAGDWPQWGGTGNRNLVSVETGLPDSFVPGNKKANGSGIDPATTKNVKWTARLGGRAYGNPTIAGGRVFIGTDDVTLDDDPRFKRNKGGLVKCFSEADGRLLWQLPVPERKDLPKDVWFVHQDLGICSSPTVEGDRVYVVTSADEVVCLDVHGQANGNDGPFVDEGQYMVGPDKPPVKLTATDADIIWRLDLIDAVGIRPHDAASCSILIHGDLLYLSTSNGVEVKHDRILAPDAPAFIAVDKRTGKLAAYEDEKLSARLYHAQWNSPSLGKVGDRTLIILGGGDGLCYAFEALDHASEQPVPLKKVWSFDAIPANYKYRDGKTIPYYDGDKRKSNGPNKNDGNFIGPSEIIGTPVFADGRVYFAIGQDPAHGRGRGMLYCIDASGTGDITKTNCLWNYDELDRSLSTVAVADGLVYAMDVAGRLHCVDAKTGKPYWVEDTKAEAWGGPLVADGKLYFGNQKLFYIMAAGKEPKILSKIRLGAPVFSTPVAANGVLYVASERYLWAVEKKKD